MSEVNPPGFLQARSDHPASAFRSAFKSITQDGVITSTDLAVSAQLSPNMSVRVAVGDAFIAGTEGTVQGVYHVINDASVTVTITASDPPLGRRDAIIARVKDSEYTGAEDEWVLEVVDGTPAGAPQDPTLPANSLLLAIVVVGANVTSITNSNILDRRKVAHTRLAAKPFVCTSSTRPATPGEGLIIYETDTQRELIYVTGTGWVLIGGRVPGVQVEKTDTLALFDNAWRRVPWTGIKNGDTSMWSSGNDGRITAPLTGTYDISTTVPFMVQSSGTANTRGVMIRKNSGNVDTGGVMLAADHRPAILNWNVTINVTVLEVPLVAGDYIEVWAIETSTTTLSFGAAAGYVCTASLSWRKP